MKTKIYYLKIMISKIIKIMKTLQLEAATRIVKKKYKHLEILRISKTQIVKKIFFNNNNNN